MIDFEDESEEDIEMKKFDQLNLKIKTTCKRGSANHKGVGHRGLFFPKTA